MMYLLGKLKEAVWVKEGQETKDSWELTGEESDHPEEVINIEEI